MVTEKRFIKTTRPSKQELRNLKNLMKQSYQVDKFNIRLYWNVLEERLLPEFDDYFYYIDGKLAGYFTVFLFKQKEAEINALVHPEHRKQGLFNYMLEQAAIDMKHRDITSCMAICHTHADIALKFVKKHQGKYDHSESEMHLVKKTKIEGVPSIDFRLATEADVPTLAKIDAQCFNTDEATMVERFTENLKERARKAWVASVDGIVVGKTHVRFNDDVAFIHDLGVSPEHRRKNYGTAMVFRLIDELREKGWTKIALDVLADNTSAIRLYEKCGFKLTAEHQFWRIKLDKLLTR